METKIARVISLVFHPLLITSYYLLIILNSPFYFTLAIHDKVKWMIFGLVFITTFLLPMILTGVFTFLIKKNMKLKPDDERNMLLSMASVFYFLTYYLLRSVQFSSNFNTFILGVATLSIFILIINNYWKISAYMVACGALTGAFAGISLTINSNLLMLILISIVISGITGFSRLQLQTHSQAQVYSGFGLGSITMSLVYLYL